MCCSDYIDKSVLSKRNYFLFIFFTHLYVYRSIRLSLILSGDNVKIFFLLYIYLSMCTCTLKGTNDGQLDNIVLDRIIKVLILRKRKSFLSS
jgi:hypothetical protein